MAKNIRVQGRRILSLSGDVEESVAGELIIRVIELNLENKKTPILLLINSPGGDIDVGFGIYDILVNSEAPIHTVGIGQVMSMGVPIYCAGIQRFAFENTTFLIHPTGWDTKDKGTVSLNDMIDHTEIMRTQSNTINQIVAKHSKLNIFKVEKLDKRQSYFNVETALRYGIINQPILTKKSFWGIIK